MVDLARRLDHRGKRLASARRREQRVARSAEEVARAGRRAAAEPDRPLTVLPGEVHGATGYHGDAVTPPAGSATPPGTARRSVPPRGRAPPARRARATRSPAARWRRRGGCDGGGSRPTAGAPARARARTARPAGRPRRGPTAG